MPTFTQRRCMTTAPSQATSTISRRSVVQAVACAPLIATLSACATHTSAAASALTTTEEFASAQWATGGARAINAAARAFQPFDAATSSCQLSCEATIGPCHTTSPQRVNISDGWDGLPLHMVLRVLDTQCQPVRDAIVEIWHTNHTGGYSGNIAQMCNNNAADISQQFFRGYQRTDAQGTVRFDTCFPGWYRARANHVHLRIMKGEYNADDRAQAWAVTQLLFPDALNQAIFARQHLYMQKGQPDTTSDTDNVMGGESNKAPYLFDIHRVDGVMVASKTLTIRTNLDAASCEIQGKRAKGFPGRPGGHMRPTTPPRI